LQQATRIDGLAYACGRISAVPRISWMAHDATASRLAAPVRFETGAMPFYHGLRLHNCQRVYDGWHQSILRSKDQAVRGTKGLPLRQMPSLNVKLMTEDHDLSQQ